MHHLFAIVVMVSACWLCGCRAKTDTITSQRRPNWADADVSAITTAELEPDPLVLPRTHFAAAQLFEQQGAINKAIVQYQRAIAGDSGFVAAWNRLGILNARIGRHNQAERALMRAVELRPDSAPLRNNLAFEYTLQNRWVDAETEFRNAIQLKPDFDRARVNLGMVLAKQEYYREALIEFASVLPDPDAFYNLGLLLRSEYRYRDAANAFERVLLIEPGFVAAKTQLDQIEPQLKLVNNLEPALDEREWMALVEALAGVPAEQNPLPTMGKPATALPSEPPKGGSLSEDAPKVIRPDRPNEVMESWPDAWDDLSSDAPMTAADPCDGSSVIETP